MMRPRCASGIPYRTQPTLRAAMPAHYRFLARSAAVAPARRRAARCFVRSAFRGFPRPAPGARLLGLRPPS
jgi:hypothetical protein